MSSPSTSPTLKEKAFDVLNRRTKLKMVEKVALLKKFLAVDVTPFSSTESGRALKVLQTTIEKGKKATWDQLYCATQLSDIYAMFKGHMATPGRVTRRGRPGSGTAGFFVDMVEQFDGMIAVFESETEVEVARDRRRQEKAAKRFTNAKTRPQDDVEWDIGKQEAEPCPGCGHYYTMAMESRETIDGENGVIRAENDQRLREFDGLSGAAKKDKKRPTKKKGKTQTVGCYCFRMNCLLQQSGGTCVSCRMMSDAGEDRFTLDANGNRQCSCDICKCDCCIFFPRNRRYEVALAAASKTEVTDVIDVDDPASTVSLLGSVILNGIQNGVALARQKKVDSTPEEVGRDASAYALQGLLGSTQFRSARAVKDLQTAMGPIPGTVGGKDINTLRREKKSGRELIAQQDIRFIRNKLSKKPITGPSSSHHTPVVISECDLIPPSSTSFAGPSASLPTPLNLESSGVFKPTSAAGARRGRIRRASLKMKYDKTANEDAKEEATKLVNLTKSQRTPNKEERVTELLEDTIVMGLDTGQAKEMMIAELGNDI